MLVYRGEGVCWGGIWFAPGWGLLRLAAAWPVGARVRGLSVRVVSVAAGCGSLIRRCCVVMLWHSLGCFNLVSRPLLLVRGRSGGLHLAQPGVRGVAALYKGRDDLGTAWRFFGFARWLSSMCPDGSAQNNSVETIHERMFTPSMLTIISENLNIKKMLELKLNSIVVAIEEEHGEI
ncbi:uncharacterized protein LOC125518894 [Triticum urartu]|uniref:uncharacterized protein LOC125518894 n=1 Tax=Triticum urartu TaxID=4572 RepID=UPI00204390BB|nr:uncharacterized protein LOC125518894 [Triticum urartu]